MVVNGWTLFQHGLFAEQLDTLITKVEALAAKEPETYRSHPATKLLATIQDYILKQIPGDPSSPEFRQGNTLGKDNRHWFRAKFHGRYRLFYRFATKEKVIIYAWLNDEKALRKAGSKTDPYFVFRGMLEAGDPPGSIADMLQRSKDLKSKAE